jgi:two-component system, NarL family, nitrate/nitrite response regulator NarL
MSDIVSVVTVDAQPLYSAGIAQLLDGRARFRVVGTVVDGTEALAAIVRLAPDVAVIDPVTPGVDARGLIDALRRKRLATRVVLITSKARPGEAYEAIAVGAGAYLSKSATEDQVARAISRVAVGETVIASEFQTGVAASIRVREAVERPLLTAREQQILELMADGLSAPEIACRLMLSTATVKTHMRHIFSKLEVSERAAAVARAMRLGLLD